jgi:hypothetical protein
MAHVESRYHCLAGPPFDRSLHREADFYRLRWLLGRMRGRWRRLADPPFDGNPLSGALQGSS